MKKPINTIIEIFTEESVYDDLVPVKETDNGIYVEPDYLNPITLFAIFIGTVIVFLAFIML
jgi:hypothetical protein